MKKEKENYLDRIPCHTSGYRWTRDEGGLVTIHVVHRGFFARLAQDVFNRRSVSHIDLDAFGSCFLIETGYLFFQLNLLCRNDPHGVLKTALLSFAG